jgi:hypothetical protein
MPTYSSAPQKVFTKLVTRENKELRFEIGDPHHESSSTTTIDQSEGLPVFDSKQAHSLLFIDQQAVNSSSSSIDPSCDLNEQVDSLLIDDTAAEIFSSSSASSGWPTIDFKQQAGSLGIDDTDPPVESSSSSDDWTTVDESDWPLLQPTFDPDSS